MGLFANLIGKSTAGSTATTSQDTTEKDAYRCVQVIPNGTQCCQAVRALAGQRFLVEHVPMLPLGDCDATECRCAYERFDDRRSDYRRASDVTFDIASQLHSEDNRSSNSSGRRCDDSETE